MGIEASSRKPEHPPVGRRCRTDRPRPQPLEGQLRPTDIVGAFFICGLAFLVAAAVAGVVQWLDPWLHGRWLALHLAFVGGVSQLVLGASQFFAGAFLATDPPPRWLIRAQVLAWNSGAILLAIAVPEYQRALIWAAAGLLACGLLAWAAAITTMRRRSLRTSPWATRWYAASAGFFVLGILAGWQLGRGGVWTHGNLLDAHMSLNLAGWFGAAIVGTLHTFYPSLTQTQLRLPRLQAVTFAAWTAGVAALAIGYGWSLDWLATSGWLLLAAAAAGLLVNIAACARDAPRPLSLAARVVGAAQPFLAAGLVIAAAASIAEGPGQALTGSSRIAVGTLLVGGWIALTVLGSLVHLLAVVVRVRDFSRPMPAPRPRLETPVTALAVGAVAVLALSQGLELDVLGAVARVALIGAYAFLAARIGSLAAQVLHRARPRI